MGLQTVMGIPASGAASNGIFSLIGGITRFQTSSAALPTLTVTLSGNVDDLTAIILVNDTPAVVSGGAFSADVLLSLGPNMITVEASDPLGNGASVSMTVYLDLLPEEKTERMTTKVTGTLDDLVAAVTVNGIPADITVGQFTASVPLTDGLNTLEAIATDPAGNSSAASVQVFVRPPINPPPMPTVGTIGPPLPRVTTESTVTLSGTKASGTSVWINSVEQVPLDGATEWTAVVSLTEGDNIFLIIAKHADGGASAAVHVNIILDNLPPVINFTLPTKTNFSPFMFIGTVDDSDTVVEINGSFAARNGQNFEAEITLTLGPNTLFINAISPNGYSTNDQTDIQLGTIPVVQTVSPTNGSLIEENSLVSIIISASDAEGDPIEYQVLLDGAPLANWGPTNTHSWTPTTRGSYILELGARDAFGGFNASQSEVMVIRTPVEHP